MAAPVVARSSGFGRSDDSGSESGGGVLNIGGWTFTGKRTATVLLKRVPVGGTVQRLSR